MSDIVERLRRDHAWKIELEAAGEIILLRSERDAAKTLCDEMAKALEEAKFALFSSDMTIKDRADQSMRLALGALAKAMEAE
ncbi:hypothetical protein G6K93_07405 [Agrobacterium rhizogenes]|nr:hypothetical protein [Rhizobium rhizogenes]